MVRAIEYDFLTWTSFPSSLKIVNDVLNSWHWYSEVGRGTPVKPGGKLKVSVKAKLQNVVSNESHVAVDGWNGSSWVRLMDLGVKTGTIDWAEWNGETTVPAGIQYIRCNLAAGGGTPEGITWYDDLKIYQDGALIYANDFSNWNPIIGAGAGAAVGAVAGYALTKKPIYALAALPGALIGGIVGYLTVKKP